MLIKQSLYTLVPSWGGEEVYQQCTLSHSFWHWDRANSLLSSTLSTVCLSSSPVVWNGRIRSCSSSSAPTLSYYILFLWMSSFGSNMMLDGRGSSSIGSPFGITTCSIAILASCKMEKNLPKQTWSSIYRHKKYCLQGLVSVRVK